MGDVSLRKRAEKKGEVCKGRTRINEPAGSDALVSDSDVACSAPRMLLLPTGARRNCDMMGCLGLVLFAVVVWYCFKSGRNKQQLPKSD